MQIWHITDRYYNAQISSLLPLFSETEKKLVVVSMVIINLDRKTK